MADSGNMGRIIDVIIPAYNEEKSIKQVISDIPKDLVRHIFICDNGSNDHTAEFAKQSGAVVLHAPDKGYGNACLRGMAHIASLGIAPDIVVFLDGDYSDHPEEMPEVVSPVSAGDADMVIGSRALGTREKGAMMPQQIFGNMLATTLIRWIYGYRYTDLGPFRAINYKKLVGLGMEDRNYGWTVEMQVKAARQKLRVTEVPVKYRQRLGVSKVSGTLRGTFMAGYKIIWTIFKLLLQ